MSETKLFFTLGTNFVASIFFFCISIRCRGAYRWVTLRKSNVFKSYLNISILYLTFNKEGTVEKSNEGHIIKSQNRCNEISAINETKYKN